MGEFGMLAARLAPDGRREKEPAGRRRYANRFGQQRYPVVSLSVCGWSIPGWSGDWMATRYALSMSER